jgi:hypothetical protein
VMVGRVCLGLLHLFPRYSSHPFRCVSLLQRKLWNSIIWAPLLSSAKPIVTELTQFENGAISSCWNFNEKSRRIILDISILVIVIEDWFQNCPLTPHPRQEF